MKYSEEMNWVNGKILNIKRSERVSMTAAGPERAQREAGGRSGRIGRRAS